MFASVVVFVLVGLGVFFSDHFMWLKSLLLGRSIMGKAKCWGAVFVIFFRTPYTCV